MKSRGGQMVFDDGEIDAATPQEPADAPGLSEIAADRRRRGSSRSRCLRTAGPPSGNDQSRAPHIGYEATKSRTHSSTDEASRGPKCALRNRT